jgi:hypothetical protein
MIINIAATYDALAIITGLINIRPHAYLYILINTVQISKHTALLTYTHWF